MLKGIKKYPVYNGYDTRKILHLLVLGQYVSVAVVLLVITIEATTLNLL